MQDQNVTRGWIEWDGLGVIPGVVSGSGVVTYQGRDYLVTINGLDVGLELTQISYIYFRGPPEGLAGASLNFSLSVVLGVGIGIGASGVTASAQLGSLGVSWSVTSTTIREVSPEQAIVEAAPPNEMEVTYPDAEIEVTYPDTVSPSYPLPFEPEPVIPLPFESKPVTLLPFEEIPIVPIEVNGVIQGFSIDTIDPATNLISTINQSNIDGTPHLVRISALADTDAYIQQDFSFDDALNAFTPVANTFNFGDSSYDLGDLPPGISVGVASEALPPVTGLYDQVFGVPLSTDGGANYNVPTFNFYDSDNNVVRQLSYAQAAEATDDGRPAIAQSQAVDTNYSTNADDSWNFNTNRIVEGGFVADSSVGMVDGTLVTLTNPPPDDGIINDEGGDDTLPGGGGNDDLTPPEDSGPTLTTGRWRTSVSNGEEQGPPPPPTPPIITGAAIGRIFGSSLASLIDTDNVFEDIAISAALQTGLGAVGATVDTLIGNGQIADISLVDASGNFQFNAGALAANDNCPMIEEAAA